LSIAVAAATIATNEFHPVGACALFVNATLVPGTIRVGNFTQPARSSRIWLDKESSL